MTNRSKKTPDVPSFDSTINSLEKLIDALEVQEMTLEESLVAFETGITLARKAQLSLSAAEQKVRTLLENVDSPLEVPFESGGISE